MARPMAGLGAKGSWIVCSSTGASSTASNLWHTCSVCVHHHFPIAAYSCEAVSDGLAAPHTSLASRHACIAASLHE